MAPHRNTLYFRQLKRVRMRLSSCKTVSGALLDGHAGPDVLLDLVAAVRAAGAHELPLARPLQPEVPPPERPTAQGTILSVLGPKKPSFPADWTVSTAQV